MATGSFTNTAVMRVDGDPSVFLTNPQLFGLQSQTSTVMTWKRLGNTACSIDTVYTAVVSPGTVAIQVYRSNSLSSSDSIGEGAWVTNSYTSGELRGLATIAQANVVGWGGSTNFFVNNVSNYAALTTRTATSGEALNQIVLYDNTASPVVNYIKPGNKYTFTFRGNRTASTVAGQYVKFRIYATYGVYNDTGTFLQRGYLAATGTSSTSTPVTWQWSTSAPTALLGTGAATTSQTFVFEVPTLYNGYSVGKIYLLPLGSTSQSGSYSYNTANRFHFYTLSLQLQTGGSATPDLTKVVTRSALSGLSAEIVASPRHQYADNQCVEYQDLKAKSTAASQTYTVYFMTSKATSESTSTVINYKTSSTASTNKSVTSTGTTVQNQVNDGFYHNVGTITSSAAPEVIRSTMTVTTNYTGYSAGKVIEYSNGAFYIHPPKYTYVVKPVFQVTGQDLPTEGYFVTIYAQMSMGQVRIDLYSTNENSGQLRLTSEISNWYECVNSSGYPLQNSAEFYFGSMTSAQVSCTEIRLLHSGERDDRTCLWSTSTQTDTANRKVYIKFAITDLGHE